MSVVVVGVHERDAPLELLERLAVGDGGPRARRSPRSATARTSPRRSCSRPACAPRSTPWSSGSTTGSRTSTSFFHGRAGASHARGAATLDERLVVAYDDAAARHLFEVAAGVGLGGARRGRDPPPGAPGRRAGRGRAGRRPRPRRAVPPRPRGRQAGPHRDRDRAGDHLARARRPSALAAERLPDARAAPGSLVVGAGEMGAAFVLGARGVARGAELVVASREPGRGERLAAAVGGRGDRPGGPRRRARRRGRRRQRHDGDRRSSLDADRGRRGDGRAPGARSSSSTPAVPRDVEPAVGRLPGVTLLTSTTCTPPPSRRWQARRGEVPRSARSSRRSWSGTGPRCSAGRRRPVVSALRVPLPRRSAWPSSSASAGGSSASSRTSERSSRRRSRRLVAKLLHEPTVQVKQAAGSPRGERLAEALRLLFDL